MPSWQHGEASASVNAAVTTETVAAFMLRDPS
jgi:hypothetical protein